MDAPLILHLETSGKNCSVAVTKGTEILCSCEEMSEQFSHSKKLHTFIQWAMEGADISLKELNAISVSQGPGSYTGLRIGVSAAKGLAFGLAIPLIANQSLRTLAMPYILAHSGKTIVATLVARQNEIYCQSFLHPESLSEPRLAVVNSSFFEDIPIENVLVIGNGADLIQMTMKDIGLPIENFSFENERSISAQNAVIEAIRKFDQSEFEDVAYFEPQYIKPVHVTPPKKII